MVLESLHTAPLQVVVKDFLFRKPFHEELHQQLVLGIIEHLLSPVPLLHLAMLHSIAARHLPRQFLCPCSGLSTFGMGSLSGVLNASAIVCVMRVFPVSRQSYLLLADISPIKYKRQRLTRTAASSACLVPLNSDPLPQLAEVAALCLTTLLTLRHFI